MADAIHHGTAYLLTGVIRHGEMAASAKHSDVTISELRRLVTAGERQTDLAKEFGISKAHVNRIWKGTARIHPVADNDNHKAGGKVA